MNLIPRRLCRAALTLLMLAFVAVPRTLHGATNVGTFVEEAIGGAWNEAVGLTFSAEGQMFVWERAGRVWLVENGVKQSQPLLDISDEVGAWKDHGLMGFALHPDFVHNGYLYLLYVVDHYHLANAGTAGYDPAANDYFRATIG